MKRVMIPILFLIVLQIVNSACRNTKKGELIFDSKYPPITEIPYSVNGKEYNISAFEGQCMLFFDETVSHSRAHELVKQCGGKIIEQMPVFNYYLVKVPHGKEPDFVMQLRERNDVLYTFFNLPYTIESQVYILDNFKDMKESLLTTHGTAVKQTFSKYGMGKSIHCEHILELSQDRTDVEDSLLMAGNNIVGKIFSIAKDANAEDVILINMSFGPRLNGKSKNGDLIKNVEPKYQEEYKIAYEESLKSLAISFAKVRNMGLSNFIVTKSSGNEGYHDLDSILIRLDEHTISSLKKNFVLVNALDNKYKTRKYSNFPSKKHDLCTTIDITEESFSGTSFASPKLLGYIDKLMTEYKTINAQDILMAIRCATPDNPHEAMTYDMLEKEVKKLSNKQYKQYSYILDMTSEYSGEWNLSDVNDNNIIKYNIHNTYGGAYFIGLSSAIDIYNTSDIGMDIFLEPIDTDKDIRSMRCYLAPNEQQSFFAYNTGTMDRISISKLKISITIW